MLPVLTLLGRVRVLPALSCSPGLRPLASAITNHSDGLPYIWLAIAISESPSRVVYVSTPPGNVSPRFWIRLYLPESRNTCLTPSTPLPVSPHGLPLA